MDSAKPQNSPVLKCVIIVHILHTRQLRKSKVNEHFQGHEAEKSWYLVQAALQSFYSEPPAPVWKKVNESLLRAYSMLSPAAAHDISFRFLDNYVTLQSYLFCGYGNRLTEMRYQGRLMNLWGAQPRLYYKSCISELLRAAKAEPAGNVQEELG